jgi:hypothetical protein
MSEARQERTVRGRRVLVLGIMGQTPFAGVTWQVLHYLEGFRRLGVDVYYLEDTGAWPFDPERNTITSACGYAVEYIGRHLAWCGLPDRWAYRAATDGRPTFGLSETALARVVEGADALVNLTGATVLRDEYLRVPVRIYLETDPVRPQIEVAQGRPFTVDLLGAHTHLFTFGENLGAPDCPLPVGRFVYHPTRQPVVLDWWAAPPARGRRAEAESFTTIATWKQSRNDLQWNGTTYHWSKHREFLKFVDLPRRVSQPFQLALAAGDATVAEFREVRQRLKAQGWRVVDALAISRDIGPYREYILGSRGEFTVAKDQNVRLRSGWFSDRSACYLAAGLPVITQDCGFDKMLPTGRGLFAFSNMHEILQAVEEINSDYGAHGRAAREIAAEYFSADRVVARLAERAGL